MKQQTAWNNEYRGAQGVPTSTKTKPSSAVMRLLKYVEEHELNTGNSVIDLGCGVGRNALFLAEQGYDVTAVDFSHVALKKLEQKRAESTGAASLTVKQLDLSHPLPFEDSAFDMAIDIVTTMTLDPGDMKNFVAELRRIIKPGDLSLTYVLSDDDGYLAEKNPGGGSTTVEETGVTDNYFSKAFLEDLYADWEFLVFDKVEKEDGFYGGTYMRRIWWLLLKNKKEGWQVSDGEYEVVHVNPWYEVRKEKIMRPTGEPGEFYVVHKGPLVFVVAMTDDNEIVLIKLYRYTTKVESVEIVAGATDGEEPLVAAQRELKEETGYTAVHWHNLGKIQSENGITDRFADVYLATQLTLTEDHEREEEGITEVFTKSAEEVRRMISGGTITDMGTIGSLFLAINYLQSKGTDG